MTGGTQLKHPRVIGGPGEEGAKEALRAGFLTERGAAFKVAGGNGEGREMETRAGGSANEGLGRRCGPLIRLGASPLGAEVAGRALDHELGVGQGQSPAEGADAGPQRAKDTLNNPEQAG